MNLENHNYEFGKSYLCFFLFIVMKTGLFPNNEWLNSYKK